MCSCGVCGCEGSALAELDWPGQWRWPPLEAGEGSNSFFS